MKSNCGRDAEGILAVARRVRRSGGGCGRGFGLTANDVLDGYRLIFRDRVQGNVVGNREGIYDRKRNPWRRNKRGERVKAARRFKAMIPQPLLCKGKQLPAN